MKDKEGTNYELFENLYKGYDKNFHQYKDYRLKGSITCDMLCYGAVKTMAEDWASLLIGEGVSIKTDNEDFDNMLEDNFIPELAPFLEKVMAIGQGLILPYIYDDKVHWKLFSGTKIEVSSFINSKPKEVILYDKEYITLLNYDEKINQYNITHKKYNDKDRVELPEPSTMLGEINYFKPNITNNKTFTTHGLSVFANGVDLLRDIDLKFTDQQSEFTLSKKRLFITSNLVNVTAYDDEGKEVARTFDDGQSVYEVLGEDDEIKNEMLKETGGEIRYTAYSKSLADSYKRLGDIAGLRDYYSVEKAGSVAKNELQILSEDKKLYTTRGKHIKLFEKQLRIVIENMLNLLNLKVKEIIVEFDDSIFTDEATERQRDSLLVEAGLMSVKRFLIKHSGLSEEEVAEELLLLSDVIDNELEE